MSDVMKESERLAQAGSELGRQATACLRASAAFWQDPEITELLAEAEVAARDASAQEWQAAYEYAAKWMNLEQFPFRHEDEPLTRLPKLVKKPNHRSLI